MWFSSLLVSSLAFSCLILMPNLDIVWLFPCAGRVGPPQRCAGDVLPRDRCQHARRITASGERPSWLPSSVPPDSSPPASCSPFSLRPASGPASPLPAVSLQLPSSWL